MLHPNPFGIIQNWCWTVTQSNKETIVYVYWIYRYYWLYVLVFALKLHMLMLLSPPVSFLFWCIRVCIVLFQATSFNERNAFLVAFQVLRHLLHCNFVRYYLENEFWLCVWRRARRWTTCLCWWSRLDDGQRACAGGRQSRQDDGQRACAGGLV